MFTKLGPTEIIILVVMLLVILAMFAAGVWFVARALNKNKDASD